MIIDKTTNNYNSIMPPGLRFTEEFTATNNTITATNLNIRTAVHPFLKVSPKGTTLGIEECYNMTTKRDIVIYISKITNDTIYFEGNAVSNGDKIKLTFYADSYWLNYARSIEPSMVEQWYRSAAHMDRNDYGNYPPSILYALKDTDYDSARWVYKDKLFYSQCGYKFAHGKFQGNSNTLSAITDKEQVILDFSTGSPHTVGTFVGDKTLGPLIDDVNAPFSICPYPISITKIAFLCDVNNFTSDLYNGIILSVNIDGNVHTCKTAPGILDSDDLPIHLEKFGTEQGVILSHSGLFDYNSLPDDYILWEHDERDGMTYVPLSIINLGHTRIKSIRITAKLIRDAADESGDGIEEIDQWILSVSGYIPYAYEEGA